MIKFCDLVFLYAMGSLQYVCVVVGEYPKPKTSLWGWDVPPITTMNKIVNISPEIAP